MKILGQRKILMDIGLGHTGFSVWNNSPLTAKNGSID
jgi:hypothetical protein